jgi:hypothetical protein
LADAGVPSFEALRLVNLGFERVDATRLAESYFALGRFRQGMDIATWVRSRSRQFIETCIRGTDNRKLDYDFEKTLSNA